jgi:ubiquinol-cytochrome c reductase cytochrome c subunit
MPRRLATWLRRPGRTPRRLRGALALLLGALSLVMLAEPGAPHAAAGAAATGPAATGPAATGDGAAPVGADAPAKLPAAPAPGEATLPTPSSPALIAGGRALYEQSCSSCHGSTLQGRRGIAPALVGVGAGPVDFYLSSGRMPLENPRAEPQRATPRFGPHEIEALVAYVSAFGGPPAPAVHPARGDLALGLHEFTLNCAGCHQIVARGGLTIGAYVPDLQSASAQQVAEAVRMGPYLMPRFGPQQIDQHQLDSLARYVLWTRAPADKGGWGIYNLGPIPEGIVAWFIGLAALVLVARLIGERAT